MTDLDKARQMINEVDREMARLFERRMDAVRLVAAYKKEHGIPVEDTSREEEILRRNAEWIEIEEYRSYYVSFLRNTIELSKSMQRNLLDEQ